LEAKVTKIEAELDRLEINQNGHYEMLTTVIDSYKSDMQRIRDVLTDIIEGR